MLENYEYERLLIGNLVTLTNLGFGPQNVEEGPYIFYKKTDENNQEKYIEVFTEEEYDLSSKPSSTTGGRDYKLSKEGNNTFGKTYVKPIDEIANYLTEEEKEKLNLDGNILLNKRRIVQIYKDVTSMLAIKHEEQRIEVEKLERQYILNNHTK